jgi:hypothetical protein
VILLKKKTNADAIEDGKQNGPAPAAAGEAPPPEVTPPPLPDPSPDSFAQTPAKPPPLPEEPPPLSEPEGHRDSPHAPPPVHELPVATAPTFDPQFAARQAPVAQPAPPTASLVITAPDPALEDRLRRLEALLTQAQVSLHTAEQRASERTQTQQPTPAGPSVLGQARALLDVGRSLLPALPAGQAPPKPKGWLIWEMVAEVRAMVCMYVDPRYRVAWYAYVVPPALFLAFLFTKFWFPFALVLEKASMAWLVVVPVDLLLLYSMFKILGHEARRYRETAPDLPPSLRL